MELAKDDIVSIYDGSNTGNTLIAYFKGSDNNRLPLYIVP